MTSTVTDLSIEPFYGSLVQFNSDAFLSPLQRIEKGACQILCGSIQSALHAIFTAAHIAITPAKILLGKRFLTLEEIVPQAFEDRSEQYCSLILSLNRLSTAINTVTRGIFSVLTLGLIDQDRAAICLNAYLDRPRRIEHWWHKKWHPTRISSWAQKGAQRYAGFKDALQRGSAIPILGVAPGAALIAIGAIGAPLSLCFASLCLIKDLAKAILGRGALGCAEEEDLHGEVRLSTLLPCGPYKIQKEEEIFTQDMLEVSYTLRPDPQSTAWGIDGSWMVAALQNTSSHLKSIREGAIALLTLGLLHYKSA